MYPGGLTMFQLTALPTVALALGKAVMHHQR